MAARGDGQKIPPEVLRQLGAVIDLAAMRTGTRINSGDSTLLGMILASLSPGELNSLTSSPDQVLGKVASIITTYADADLKAQGVKQAKGPDATGEGPDSAKQGHVSAGHGKRFERWLNELAGRASNEGESSSARFSKAGRVPGNADARGFTPADHNSPLGRAIMSSLLQRWLGHARMTTTAIYAEVSGEEERAFAARFWRANDDATPGQGGLKVRDARQRS